MNYNEKSLSVQTIYPSFMGEVNVHGIGAACTFVRFNGCNLRCYKDMGLCDTPEALKRSEHNMTIDEIVDKVISYRNRVVCLTGGEPLLQDNKALHLLIGILRSKGCSVVIETNGTMPIKDFAHIKGVSLVVDYKVKSTGVKMTDFFLYAKDLDESDYVKFVLYDEADFIEAKNVIWKLHLLDGFKGNIAVGLYWGSKMTYKDLRREFLTDLLMDNEDFLVEPKLNIYINMQTHKMVCLYDDLNEKGQVLQTLIPKDL